MEKFLIVILLASLVMVACGGRNEFDGDFAEESVNRLRRENPPEKELDETETLNENEAVKENSPLKKLSYMKKRNDADTEECDKNMLENHHHKTYITFLSNDFDSCGSKIFNESNAWEKYKRGFSFGRELWLGLDTLHSLTKTGKWNLIIKMKWWKKGEWGNDDSEDDPKRGEWGRAAYCNFKVKDEASNYQWTFSNSVVVDNLHLGCGVIGNYNNMMFSTADRDNDKIYKKNCAQVMGGGFWHNECGLTEFFRQHGIKEGGYEDKKYCSSKTQWFTPSKIIMAIFHD